MQRPNLATDTSIMENSSDVTKSPVTLYFAFLSRLPAGDRLLLHILVSVIVASGIWMLLTINNHYSQSVTVRGGSLQEGMLGTPRYINPVLATTRADLDMVSLVYSGVISTDDAGNLVPNLAESITISDDGTEYEISLRQDILFHDGTPLTAGDVLFTYTLIQDADLKSPLRGNWNNVVIEQIDSHNLLITLPEPYTPFIENLTVGILPAHIWSGVSSAEIPSLVFNTQPIGSGIYRIASVQRNSIGVINQYTLAPHTASTAYPHFTSGFVRFYPDAQALTAALRTGEITTAADIPVQNLERFADSNDFTIHSKPLPHVFSIFFNQNRSAALRNESARKALALAIDREEIITESLYGFGLPTDSPIPAGFDEVLSSETSTSSDGRIEGARTILSNGGWEENEDGIWERDTDNDTIVLAITLRSQNLPMYDAATRIIAEQWRAIGAEVQVELYEQSDLLNSIIRPRDFEAVLFGIDVGRTVDLYPFWHSSQQIDPGNNLAQYASISIDRELEILRRSASSSERMRAQTTIADTLRDELPAIFLFSPLLNYVAHNDVSVTLPSTISRTSDRFHTTATWHTERDTLWPLFHSLDTVVADE